MRVLGVIPARGGSKSIVHKNIALLGGKPLIQYTIEASQNSNRLTDVIVSTDDKQIAQICEQLGASVPFMRSAELSGDKALSIHVMQHALSWMETHGKAEEYDAVMMLQPTSPFRTSEDIDSSINKLIETDSDSVISVVDVEATHPARMKYLKDGFLIDPEFCEAYENQPRQELTPMFIRNGAIYLTKRKILLSGSFKGKICAAYIMPKSRSANIDTQADLNYCNYLLQSK